MATGCVKVKFNQEKLDEVLPENELDNIAQAVIKLNEWAIPHWDLVNIAHLGSVQVNTETVNHILDRLRIIFPNDTQGIMMTWLNYGWKINNDLSDWEFKIDFNQIDYQ